MHGEHAAPMAGNSAFMRRWPACALAGVLILGLMAAPTQAQANAAAAPEENVKAAFIFNFAVFTEWPATSLALGAPLILCIYPGNSLQAALSGLNDKVVNGSPLQVRQLHATARLNTCHILVLGNADHERWGNARKELADASILTVADEAGRDDGAVITLGMANRRVGFDITLAAARQARLVLSSKLLRLARSVQ